MNGTEPKGPYSFLHSLSTDELETLLRAGEMSEEDDDPELTDRILEVIVEREKNEPGGSLPDVKRARREFDEFYRDLEQPLYDSSPVEKEPSGTKQAQTRAVRSAGRHRNLRRVLIAAVAAALLLALTVVPVFGYANVIQMVAHLANGTFRFVPDSSGSGNSGSQSTVQPDGTYETLPEALEAYGIHAQVFPQVLAEEFEQTSLKIEEYPLSKKTSFSAQYKNEEQTLMLTIVRYTDPNTQSYETNEDLENPDFYKINGIAHYILQNLDRTIITWYIDNLECSLRGNFSATEAEVYIDSIYKRS